jgi:hypothetical protein
MWISILLYAVMVYMIFNIYKTSKLQKKRQQLIQCVNNIKEKDAFFAQIDEVINNNQQDPSMVNKARVIKLWGEAYHSSYENFEETLNSIDLNSLTQIKKDKVSIGPNEDSFFYLYLGIPNILYRDEREDLIAKMQEKMDPMKETLSSQLVYAISVEINKFYQKEGDLGLAFYEKLLNGDYGEYTYGKSMIGLYKSIANATAARIYLDQGDTEKYQQAEGLLKDFNLSGVGHRWLETLHIELPEEKTEEEAEAGTETEDNTDTEAETETYIVSDASAKKAEDVIDAEVVQEEEKKEDQK